MVSTRRLGAEDSASRDALLDAAQALLIDEGYAAVTSRRVAARAGLKPQLVHYYFATMDDLYLALIGRGSKRRLALQAEALASATPLRALWDLMNAPASAQFTMELMSLANHRKEIRAVMLAQADQFRRLQIEAVSALVDGMDINAAALVVLMTSVSQVIAQEQTLGMSTGHSEMLAEIHSIIGRHEAATLTRPSAGARHVLSIRRRG